MGWVLLAIGAAAAVAGAVAVLRSGGKGRRRSGAVIYRQRPRTEHSERPYREAAHYRASGALPRWDP
jgi:hypothetical protein